MVRIYLRVMTHERKVDDKILKKFEIFHKFEVEAIGITGSPAIPIQRDNYTKKC